MREILFRGKSIDDGKWVEGYLLKIPSPIQWGASSPWFIDVPPQDPDGIYSRFNVDEKTVGQYTGLTDKNGKKIFEGDICQTKGFPLIDDKPFVVEWNDDECSFYWRDAIGTDEFNIGVSQNTTIIGNIHDTPELLKRRMI